MISLRDFSRAYRLRISLCDRLLASCCRLSVCLSVTAAAAAANDDDDDDDDVALE